MKHFIVHFKFYFSPAERKLKMSLPFGPWSLKFEHDLCAVLYKADSQFKP